MDLMNPAAIQSELLARRGQLDQARPRVSDAQELERLIGEIDAALGRIEGGRFGLCEVCHDPIEADRLAADPLITVCLDHMNAEQRQALQQDLDLAYRIQDNLLPDRGLSCAGWETYYHYAPIGPVSGDFCDLIRCSGHPESLFFVIGDVSGKGVAASLLMSHLHAILRTLVAVQLPVEQIVQRANRLFCEGTMATHYATLICGTADASGEIEFCNAGHCAPLVVRAGEVRAIESSGLPLGMFCEASYSTSRVRLTRGDSLILFTDGLTEAGESAGREYGTERLMEAVLQARSLGAAALTRACLDDLKAFLGDQRMHDDLTLLVLSRSTPEA